MPNPPRKKPCPACGAPCGTAATACRQCGHQMPRRPGSKRAAPSPEERLAAAMQARAYADGHTATQPPEIGRRRALKPDRVRTIRALASEGLTIRQIGERLGLAPSGIRRYCNDYGIATSKASVMYGPSFDGKTAKATELRLQQVRFLVEGGMPTLEIAAALGINPATARVYMKRARERFGLRLTGRFRKSKPEKD